MTCLLKLLSPGRSIYCVECYKDETASDICRLLLNKYGDQLESQFPDAKTHPPLHLGLLHNGNPIQSYEHVKDIPHGTDDVLSIVATIPSGATTQPTPELPRKPGDVLHHPTPSDAPGLGRLVVLGFPRTEVERRWQQNVGDYDMTLRDLLIENTTTVTRKLTPDQKKDIIAIRQRVKKATLNDPSDVDLLCAYIGSHGNWNRQRATDWMLGKPS